jgi:hypothetical protein
MDLLMKLDSFFLYNIGMVFQFIFFYEIIILCALNFTIFT